MRQDINLQLAHQTRMETAEGNDIIPRAIESALDKPFGLPTLTVSRPNDLITTKDITMTTETETTDTKKTKAAIDAPRGTFFKMDPGELTIIGLDTQDDETHPLYDPRIKAAVDENMVKSIYTYGVLEPIIITKRDDKVVVVDGRRRVIHARLAAKRQTDAGETSLRIPCILDKDTDAKLFAKSRVANSGRLQDGAMMNARAAKRMVDMGTSVEECAVAFGVSDQSVRNWLALLGLAPEVQQAITEQELKATAALQLVNLTVEQQRETLSELKADAAAGKKTTVGSARKKAQNKAGASAPTGLTPKDRVDKSVSILTKIAGGAQTKEALLEGLNKLSRVLAGKGYDKLGEEE